MMELSPSSSFCPGTFPPTTNFFLFNRTKPPVHINNLNNQTKPPVHINNLRVNQGCPVPAKRVGLIKNTKQTTSPRGETRDCPCRLYYQQSKHNTPYLLSPISTLKMSGCLTKRRLTPSLYKDYQLQDYQLQKEILDNSSTNFLLKLKL